jgi:hypothetical protein
VIELPTERQVQRSILSMMGTCFPQVFVTAIPNGAHLAGDKVARFKQMGALKGDGLKVGFPDLLCLWADGKGALIVVNRPKTGDLTDSQKALHPRLEAIGWPVTVVTTPDEVFALLRGRGAPWSGVEWGRVAA